MPRCQLLGLDHDEYGRVTTVAVGDRAAASISVGADERSPSLRFKGSGAVPNEDALCLVDGGDRLVMAVADAHFGHEASHVLINHLQSGWSQSVPENAAQLLASVERLAGAPKPQTTSESTLLVAWFDRTSGQGLAVNIGDSTLARLTPAGEYVQINVQDEWYVAAGDQWHAGAFTIAEFSANPGDTLIMFTDGVNECHYRQPATSVRPEHIIWVAYAALDDAEQTSEQLAQLALSGVDGHPGGQDNLAIIVVQV